MALIYSYYIKKLLLVNPIFTKISSLFLRQKREKERNYKIEYLSEDHIRNYKRNKSKSNQIIKKQRKSISLFNA